MHIDPASGRFNGRQHLLPVRIYYEDTDLAGVVYHANHVRYLERGRSEFVRAAGVDHSTMLHGASPFTFVVTKMELTYLRPARIDDALTVVTTFDRIQGARVFNRQLIMRGTDVILGADVEMVCVSLDGRPRRPSSFLVDALRPHLLEAPAERMSASHAPVRRAEMAASLA